MKHILTALILLTGAAACTSNADYKTERDEVMKVHDVVMGDHGKLISNQMKLDSMIKNIPALKQKFPDTDTLREKEVMIATQERLKKAEDTMNDWMHQFEPDITGKSNEEAVKYFKAERVKIAKIDSLYKIEIKLSDAYLLKFRK